MPGLQNTSKRPVSVFLGWDSHVLYKGFKFHTLKSVFKFISVNALYVMYHSRSRSTKVCQTYGRQMAHTLDKYFHVTSCCCSKKKAVCATFCLSCLINHCQEISPCNISHLFHLATHNFMKISVISTLSKQED